MGCMRLYMLVEGKVSRRRDDIARIPCSWATPVEREECRRVLAHVWGVKRALDMRECERVKQIGLWCMRRHVSTQGNKA